MNQAPAGSFQIFRAFGIDVHLHWMWFLLVLILMQMDLGFPTQAWNLVAVVVIFGIVLLHEYGHALACRSVGGRADHIMLWPLGGVAFVQPPPRPGAVLWSIVAGPLVNVVLVPVLLGVNIVMGVAGVADELRLFGEWAFRFNLVILIFNMLPIYPLDGGQIVQALLWFVVGRSKSLRIAAGFGLIVAIAGGAWALSVGQLWLVIIAVFVGYQAWIGLNQARWLAQLERERGE